MSTLCQTDMLLSDCQLAAYLNISRALPTSPQTKVPAGRQALVLLDLNDKDCEPQPCSAEGSWYGFTSWFELKATPKSTRGVRCFPPASCFSLQSSLGVELHGVLVPSGFTLNVPCIIINASTTCTVIMRGTGGGGM